MRLMKQYGAAPQECCHLPRTQLTKAFSHPAIQNVSQCRSAMACCGQAPADIRGLEGRKALPPVLLTYLQSTLSQHVCSVIAATVQVKASGELKSVPRLLFCCSFCVFKHARAQIRQCDQAVVNATLCWHMLAQHNSSCMERNCPMNYPQEIVCGKLCA